MSANSSRRFVLLLLSLTLVLTGSAGCAVAQDYPSHVQVAVSQDTGFYPGELPLFASLATYEQGVISNVSRQNFTAADAQQTNYSNVVKTFQSLSLERDVNNKTAMSAITASGDALHNLVIKSKRYHDLYLEQQSLGASSPYSNQSVQNALEMRRLDSDIKAIQQELNTTTTVISSVVFPLVNDPTVFKGLYTTAYTNSTLLLDAYTSLLDRQLLNVTSLAFQNTTTTVGLDRTEAQYGNQILVSGAVQANQTGVAGGSVTLFVDRNPQFVLQTNDGGNYSYTLTIADIPAGSHTIFAHYEPNDSPYQPSNSTNATLTIQQVPVTNSFSFSGGSLASGRVTFAGRLTTTQGLPVRGSGVTLYADGTKVGSAVTDQEGNYTIAYQQNRLEVLGTLLQPDKIAFFTEFNSRGGSLSSAASQVIALPVLGTYVAQGVRTPVGAAMTAVALTVVCGGGVYVARERRKRALTVAVPIEDVAATSPVGRAIEMPIARSETVLAPPFGTEAASIEGYIQQANDLWRLGRDRAAIAALYVGALTLVGTTGHARIKPSMTHRETLRAIRMRLPAVSLPLEGLTMLYEIACFSGRTVTGQHVEAAIMHLRSIERLIRNPGEST